MALAWAFAQLDYQSSIMANEGTQTRSRQLEEQVRAMRESMDKIQADLAERMQQQSEEFQAQKQLQQQQFSSKLEFLASKGVASIPLCVRLKPLTSLCI